ncbi:hypothetical protein [Mesorhizobium tianshanense]|uniref:hypothetical protein n=1 Tax=Mesorhizobium tianshanense TaxID=39844 RepID=UPI0011A71D1F|nr:hypothetical protein [Mesorhizobium tianshanense]
MDGALAKQLASQSRSARTLGESRLFRGIDDGRGSSTCALYRLDRDFLVSQPEEADPQAEKVLKELSAA